MLTMNHLVTFARIIITSAVMRLLVITAQYHLMSIFRYDDYSNLIYLPAGVSALLLLVFSYPAAFGILCGSLIWTTLRRDFSTIDTLIYACTSTLAVTAAYFCVQTFLKHTNRRLSWSHYTLPILAAYFTLNAGFNSILRAIGIKTIAPLGEPTLQIIVIKFIGDVSGAFLLFTTLNLLAIVYLRYASLKSHSKNSP